MLKSTEEESNISQYKEENLNRTPFELLGVLQLLFRDSEEKMSRKPNTNEWTSHLLASIGRTDDVTAVIKLTARTS